MEHCPVCNMPVQTAICPECGFDSSRNYEKLPTLGPIAAHTESLDWKNVTAIAAGASHTLGFAVDGALLALGTNEDGQCNVHTLMC